MDLEKNLPVSSGEADHMVSCKFCIVGCISISVQHRLRDAEDEVLQRCIEIIFWRPYTRYSYCHSHHARAWERMRTQHLLKACRYARPERCLRMYRLKSRQWETWRRSRV